MATRNTILLVNMGGPAHLGEVGDYLRAIFNDPAILPLPGIIRSPLAEFITARRCEKVTERYRLLGGRSPLHHWSASLRNNLETELLGRGIETPVSYAFRYCSPTIEEGLTALANTGASAVTLVPLFPHYTHTMTGSVVAEARRAASALNLDIEVIADWGQHPAIIGLWSQYIEAALQEAGDGARVLFVAHGIPLRNVKRGDDYPERVHATARLLGETLQDTAWSLAFQSRVGPVKWTGPYLETELKRLSASPQPLVLMPLSFVAECLETIYDLDIVAAKEAREAGVKKVVRVRAFDDDPNFARILADLALEKTHAALS